MFERLGITIRWLRVLAAVAAVSFLFSGFLTIDMEMNHQMGVGCVVPSKNVPQSSCAMDPGAHLAWWSSAFTGILGDSSFLSLIALLGVLVCIELLGVFSDVSSPQYIRSIYWGKAPPGEKLHDYFVLFLAMGKAQPLLYA